MKKFRIGYLLITVLLLVSCTGDSGGGGSLDEDSKPQTAPSLPMTIQSNYLSDADSESSSLANTLATAPTKNQMDHATGVYKNVLAAHSSMTNALGTPQGSTGVPAWDPNTTYSSAGNKVTYETGSTQKGVFVNKWWTKGNTPSFTATSSPWALSTETVTDTDKSGDPTLTVGDPIFRINTWVTSVAYTGGTVVKSGGKCFKARYWNKAEDPAELDGFISAGTAWKSPWNKADPCPSKRDAKTFTIKLPTTKKGNPPPKIPKNTPKIPPVIPTPPPENTDTTPPVKLIAPTKLPTEGYEFLRKLTSAHWEFLFPLRYGKLVSNGGSRNQPPYATDESTDVYTLNNFIKSVLIYNEVAKKKNYKQFLNEGTLTQQAQEFAMFFAKSSQETTGTWDNAPAPWIAEYPVGSGEDMWKAALYWVEEMERTTNADGTSPVLAYIDPNNKYVPEPNRSYHGRGIVQLSWNYNYGAFGLFLYENGIQTDIIKGARTLLKRPDYVTLNGLVSFLSAIWFWQTPQGIKPSSHDVLYGEETHVSTSNTDRGLPKRNDGKAVPVAQGYTTDEVVLAARIGTIIDIVNGGLECNRQSSSHVGPRRRISWYNVYALYLNNELNLNIARVKEAVNIWTRKTKASDSEAILLGTCYAFKSYAGW